MTQNISISGSVECPLLASLCSVYPSPGDEASKVRHWYGVDSHTRQKSLVNDRWCRMALVSAMGTTVTHTERDTQ